MRGRQLLHTETGSLRPPWRILLFVAVTIPSLIVSAAVAGPIIAWLFDVLGLRVSNEWWVETIGLLGGTAIALHIEKRPWSDVWLDASAARASRWLSGFALGAACIGIPVGLLVAAGWLGKDAGVAGSWWGAAVRVTLVLFPAALLEELMTRGYILAVLRDWWGWKWAILATSVGFGLLHLRNANASAASVGLVTLAGIFLAVVIYATRSLYAAWMAHFAWNWVMAVVFHAAVSGTPFETPRYRYVDAGPDWATGGEWGPEGGIPAALGMVAGMGFLLRRRGRMNGIEPGSATRTSNVENA